MDYFNEFEPIASPAPKIEKPKRLLEIDERKPGVRYQHILEGQYYPSRNTRKNLNKVSKKPLTKINT